MNENKESDRIMQTIRDEIKGKLAESKVSGYMEARKDELEFLSSLPEYDPRIADRIAFLMEEINS